MKRALLILGIAILAMWAVSCGEDDATSSSNDDSQENDEGDIGDEELADDQDQELDIADTEAFKALAGTKKIYNVSVSPTNPCRGEWTRISWNWDYPGTKFGIYHQYKKSDGLWYQRMITSSSGVSTPSGYVKSWKWTIPSSYAAYGYAKNRMKVYDYNNTAVYGYSTTNFTICQ